VTVSLRPCFQVLTFVFFPFASCYTLYLLPCGQNYPTHKLLITGCLSLILVLISCTEGPYVTFCLLSYIMKPFHERVSLWSPYLFCKNSHQVALMKKCRIVHEYLYLPWMIQLVHHSFIIVISLLWLHSAGT
jgi:hypothetical protein